MSKKNIILLMKNFYKKKKAFKIDDTDAGKKNFLKKSLITKKALINTLLNIILVVISGHCA